MKIINILGNVLDSDANIICHQVNCMGVMGSGLAKQVKQRYPDVFCAYQTLCNNNANNPEDLLGRVQYCYLSEDKTIANIFGQCRYGKDKRYTDYDALKTAFSALALYCEVYRIRKIAFPYLFGCGLAGGDWSIVESMIEDAFKDNQNIVIEIVKYNK